MGWDLQQLRHKKVFGDYLPGTHAIRYRRAEWDKITHGKGRTTALVLNALLGVPTYHTEGDLPVWTFQFDDGGLLVIHHKKGAHAVEINTNDDEVSQDLQGAFDWLLSEVMARLLVVAGQGGAEQA